MLKTTVKFLILAVTCCSLGVGVKSYSFQNRAMRALAGVSVVTSLGLFAPMVVMDAEAKVGSEKLTRFYEAQEELKNIDSNFVDITTRRGGDGIRVKLGTVYKPPKCEYALCSFNSYMEKFIQTNVDDIDFERMEEPSIELQKALNEADFDAYSANFADYGNGAGNLGASDISDDWLNKSRKQIRLAKVKMDEVIDVLNE